MHRLFFHIIFCTHRRQPFITPKVEPILYEAIREEYKLAGATFCYLNGVADHVHMLVSTSSLSCTATMVPRVKQRSQEIMKCHDPGFLWQRGQAVFTVNPYNYRKLLHYIRDQKQRHARDTLIARHEWVLAIDEAFEAETRRGFGTRVRSCE